jgi:predicted alpha-1,2-mannosidase
VRRRFEHVTRDTLFQKKPAVDPAKSGVPETVLLPLSPGAPWKAQRVEVHIEFKRTAQPILMKIGISAVSVEAARKNLAQEIPGWDFQGVAAAARKSWEDVLGKIDVETGDVATRETFYTALYHASLAPTLYNDADGGYRGLDHQPHAPAGFQNYSTMSLWDTFRAEHPLLTIVQPQRVSDIINSMLAHYRQFHRHALPVWPLSGNETWCMIGNHAIPVIVEAYVKGFRGFDVEAAYQAMRDTLMQDRDFMDQYRAKGYVSSAGRNQSVSRTLEYAYDDWCFGRMAELLGKKDDARLFIERSANYRNVFDASVGFMRGKKADGAWRSPFDPRELVWADFTEATSWNYTWFVPHDVPGLLGLIGGQQAFIDKLDKMFNEDSTLLAAVPDMTGLIGQYVHGNEPCHHVAYLYPVSPDLQESLHPAPDGIGGRLVAHGRLPRNGDHRGHGDHQRLVAVRSGVPIHQRRREAARDGQYHRNGMPARHC